MKKIILSLILLVLLAPSVLAATFNSSSGNVFHFNEANVIQPITIRAEAPNEITAKNGIRILIDPTQSLLWDVVEKVEITGAAANLGFIGAEVVPIYSENKKEVFIPVLQDWSVGATATIYGLRFRAYRDVIYFGYFLGLDYSGDGVADANDSYTYSVVSTAPWADLTPPYAPTEVKAVVGFDPPKVNLTWKWPPDYDYEGMRVYKTLVRNGLAQVSHQMILDKFRENGFEDTVVQEGDEVTYEVLANDLTSVSPSVVVKVSMVREIPHPSVPETPVVEPQNPPVQTENAELAQLGKLYNYYKLRQSIKCMATTSEADSNCLWAEIDLIYANQLLAKPDIAVSLSARDLYLIGRRIVWPERRYQAECVQASVPEKSCIALAKAIQRAHFFIDNK